MMPTLQKQKEKKDRQSKVVTRKDSTKTTVEQDILSPDLVRQLQSRVSIFNVEKDKENFNNILSSFL